jgi:hypothetical protein
MTDKIKYITILSLTSILVGSQLIGCGKSTEISEETTTEETAIEETVIEETTTEIETSTIEETTPETETLTTEEETSTVEETTTEDETSTIEETTTEEESSTPNSEDVSTRRKNYKSKYSYDYNAHYEIYSYLDEDEDGVITDEEAASLEKILNEKSSEIDNSTKSSTSSSDSSSSSSSSDYTPFVDEVTNHVDISTIDMTGASTTGDVY